MSPLHSHKALKDLACRVPVVGRLALMFLGPCLLILCLAAEDAVHMDNEHGQRKTLELAPEYVVAMRRVAESLMHEQDVATYYASVFKNATSLREAQEKTDKELAHIGVLLYQTAADSGSDDQSAVIFKRSFHWQQLLRARALLARSSISVASIRKLFLEIVGSAIRAYYIAFHGPEKNYALLSCTVASIQSAFLRLAQTSASYPHGSKHMPSATPQTIASAVATHSRLETASETYLEFLDGIIFLKDWATDVSPAYGEAREATKQLLDTVNSDVFSGWSELSGSAVAAWALAQKLIGEVYDATRAVAREQVDVSISAVNEHFALDVVCAVLCVLFVLVLLVITAIRRKQRAFEQSQEAERVIMVDTVDRVAEYCHHFALFDLTVKLLPVEKMLTHLELTLMRCMAALKIAAPSLPAELFPERYILKPREKNQAQREMCDMELMMNQLPLNHTDSSLMEVNAAAGGDAGLMTLAVMERRCKLGMKKVEGSFLTVAMTWVHVKVEALGGQPKYLHKYIALVEEIATTHRGLMHKVLGDRILCSWNVGSETANHPLLACQAGLAILPGKDRIEADEVHVASAVTHGHVMAGNCGFTPGRLADGVSGPVSHGSEQSQIIISAAELLRKKAEKAKTDKEASANGGVADMLYEPGVVRFRGVVCRSCVNLNHCCSLAHRKLRQTRMV